MGYALSRMEIDSEYYNSDTSDSSVDENSSPNKPAHNLDHEVAQLTKLGSAPHEKLSHIFPGKREVSVNTVKMLAGRECNFSGRGRFSAADRRHVLTKYLPANSPSVIDEMTTRAYVSQFSADGSLCVVAFQGSHIRIYDVDKKWKVHKNIIAQSLRWTVTDTSFSPDQQHLVYATMSPVVHVVNIASGTTDSQANITEIHEGLEFSREDDGGYSFGIFSVKFSIDGRELVAGSSDDAIYVYDLVANKLSLRIDAHASDVNTVSFADESGNLIYSGSDDNLCKVWDRRCLKPRGKAAGVLMGHLEGVTYLDSRGDGRYLISNGKDQTIKLWDIRKMSSNSNCRPIFRKYEWDYRWMDYPPQARYLKHPSDQSVATYKGHSVLRTLIRCYFSPAYSTGQKYIYTGSHDSCIYIYDVASGNQVSKLRHHKSTVRDCSWHPEYPMLVSSAWDGDVVKWEFPGDEETSVSPDEPRNRRI
ncbi:hypothetical protein DCAR_0521019 [Daucus carota subsp. sativus]|uniref:LEC14B homolog n=1 Tax=Daucus carota subsp. sativus TaxID=79200 RepID=A0A161XTU1_DAUCS|nr:PREDICTED: LEC14B protein isoform X1 [Daucus carota subsp. sativus]WOH01635.1 hypothetical protein DCAR_0521019 [Daucus carota subsp. sativus]